jgi:hypothetical protein
MHTLKLDLITFMDTVALNRVITYGFGQHKSFPQIRSIAFPPHCDSLLKYFPSARDVHFIRSTTRQFEYRLLELADCCPLLENICFSVPSNMGVPSIFFTSYPSSANNRNPIATHPSSRPPISERQRPHIAIYLHEWLEPGTELYSL